MRQPNKAVPWAALFHSDDQVMSDEADLSTEQPRACTPPRLPLAHGDQERPEGARAPPRQGPQAAFRLICIEPDLGFGGPAPFKSSAPLPLETLKKRAEFLRVRGGGRWAGAAFVLEGKPRPGDPGKEVNSPLAAVAQKGMPDSPRIGFTVTKQIGNAVVRNRVRRRLKAAVSSVFEAHARPGYDYVLIARAPAATRDFKELGRDLERAFVRVHELRPPEKRKQDGKTGA